VAAGVAAAAIVSTTSAGASPPDLPPRTAAQLLAAVEQAHPQHLSGTVVETAHLGLPDLPSGDVGGGGLSLQALVTGSHTMRVWYGGPKQVRLALMAPMAERDVIRNGNQLWTYTSTTNSVTHSTIPGRDGAEPPHPMPAITPQQLAERALRAIDPSTEVSVDRTARVAGRPAYQLDLAPRDERSLIGSIRIAIDSTTSIPLQVQVYPRGSTSPAIQVGFTDITFSAPSPSVFRFAKPEGATVVPLDTLITDGPASTTGQTASYGKPQMLGSGWTTVLKLPATNQGGAPALPMLSELATPVPQGQLITTALVSILVTHDGTVYAGAVSGPALQQVAATGSGL
jgi:outer membrane lipoprotein-sorting protein